VQVDFLVADLLGIKWKGWQATNTKHETYFQPTTFAGFDDKGRRLVADPWERMDFWLRSKSRRTAARKKLIGRFSF
jgi:hypothetical protein